MRTAQALMFARAVDQFARLHGRIGIVVVLCGDFNSMPEGRGGWVGSGGAAGTKPRPPAQGGVHTLLRSGTLDSADPEHPSSTQDGCDGSDFDIPLQLWSAYEQTTGVEHEVTCRDSNHATCKDYIWVGYAGQAIGRCEAVSPTVLQVLEMPYDPEFGAKFSPIPNKTWPSDHLALGCTFVLPSNSARADYIVTS